MRKLLKLIFYGGAAPVSGNEQTAIFAGDTIYFNGGTISSAIVWLSQ